MTTFAFENENSVFRAAQAGKMAEVDAEYEAAYAKLRADGVQDLPMLIAGEAVTADDWLEVKDPSTGQIVARFPQGTADHVDAAVASAKAAQPSWEARGWQKRADIIDKAAVLMRERRAHIAAVMGIENGKNRLEAYYDVDEGIDFLVYYAATLRAHEGFNLKLGKPFPDETCTSVMRPWGVFAVVGPFNFPAAIPCGMTTGALITGNAVVMKPASDAPWSAYEVMRLLHDAGVPKDVLHFVTGGGRVVGQPLIDHPDIGGLVFTGSRGVGMNNLGSFVGNRPRPYIAEMGGKNAIVVTDNADLDKAAEGVMKSAFGFSGQKCSACSRAYVHDSVYDEFVSKLVAKSRELKVGFPWERDTILGPLINQEAVDTYLDAVAGAKKAGGTFLLGGNLANQGDLSNGFFVEPAIVADLPDGHDAFRTEYFVPFVALARYHDFDDVIHEVNQVEYGLTSGIFSTDPAEQQAYFDKVQAGVVYANRHRGGSSGAMVGGQSFGGWKYSATTSRGAGGPWYLLQFVREQSRTQVE